jgi:hypothetical protein
MSGVFQSKASVTGLPQHSGGLFTLRRAPPVREISYSQRFVLPHHVQRKMGFAGPSPSGFHVGFRDCAAHFFRGFVGSRFGLPPGRNSSLDVHGSVFCVCGRVLLYVH